MWYILSDKGHRKLEDLEASTSDYEALVDEEGPRHKVKGSKDKDLVFDILSYVRSMNTATDQDILENLMQIGYKEDYIEHEVNRLVSNGNLREFMHYPSK